MGAMSLLELQTYLSQHYHVYHGRVDGVWGPITRASLHLLLNGSGAYSTALASQDRMRVAGEQLIYRDVGKLPITKIDGLVGPETLHARTLWAATPWRDRLMAELPGDERFPPKKHDWPAQDAVSMTNFYGAPGQNLTMLELPFPMRLAWDMDEEIHRFQINEKCKPSALRALNAILDAYGHTAIIAMRLDLFGGCYNNRPMRGGTRPSTHSWGAAIDFDPMNNQLRWDHSKASLAEPGYALFWKAWEDEGWTSLGRTRDMDWMHVQAANL